MIMEHVTQKMDYVLAMMNIMERVVKVCTIRTI